MKRFLSLHFSVVFFALVFCLISLPVQAKENDLPAEISSFQMPAETDSTADNGLTASAVQDFFLVSCGSEVTMEVTADCYQGNLTYRWREDTYLGGERWYEEYCYNGGPIYTTHVGRSAEFHCEVKDEFGNSEWVSFKVSVYSVQEIELNVPTWVKLDYPGDWVYFRVVPNVKAKYTFEVEADEDYDYYFGDWLYLSELRDAQFHRIKGGDKPTTAQELEAGTVYYFGVGVSWDLPLWSEGCVEDRNVKLTICSGWVQDVDGWKYVREDGTCPVDQWELIKGKWYHFDANGYMQTGWITWNEKRYYLLDNGAMVTGWKKINGEWYYFNPGGTMQTRWKLIDDVWYFFHPSGVMAANEWHNGYCLDENGAWTYQNRAFWKKNAYGWWYGDESGWYAKNCTLTINDKQYTFDARGYWVK